jgi:hypothetical protein
MTPLDVCCRPLGVEAIRAAGSTWSMLGLLSEMIEVDFDPAA